MKTADWKKVRAVFEAALSAAEQDRPGLVNQLAGSDSTLRGAVLELLANHQDESGPDADRPAPSRVFQDGELVASRFEVIRFIDRGGMGEVYEVWDRRLRLRCALKTVRPELTGTPASLERCEREIRVARNVSHENLCRVFEFIEHTPQEPEARVVPCLTMEFVDGISLAARLQRDGPFPWQEALPLIRQMASGLAVLHAEGIVHRDLKPSNIMVTRRRSGEDRAVLMDFGLAKDLSSDSFESTGISNAGAPYFMAPELLRNTTPGVPADIYAFGLVIDEMVTSRRAFEGGSVQAICYAKLFESPIPPAQRAAHLPDSWNNTILRCLDSDPAKRFPQAQDVIAALSAAPESPPKRRKLWIPALLTALILLPCILLALLALRPTAASISVFEIENQTGERNLEYLCTGLTNELIRRLASLRETKVIPMRASRSKTIGTDPGRFSLGGSLQQHAGQLQLAVSVLDNRTGSLLWSGNFDRGSINEPVETQSEIASSTVIALQQNVIFGSAGRATGAGVVARALIRLRSLLQLPGGAAITAPPTTSNLALDKYMRARELIVQDPPEAIQSGINLLNAAIAEDPGFALAYAALAQANINFTGYAYNQTQRRIALARQYADRAVSIDPNLPEAHEALGMVLEREWAWNQAREQYALALGLKPSLASSRRRLGRLLIETGHIEEGVSEVRRSAQDDPYDPSGPNYLGLTLFLAGKYQEALQVLEKAAQRQENLGGMHNLADVHAELAILSTGAERDYHLHTAFGLADRVTALETQIRTDPRIRTPWGDKMHAHFYSIQGNLAAAAPYLERMLTDMKEHLTSPANVAMVLTAQGRNREALDLLEQCLEQRDPYLPLTPSMPFFVTLRKEARFQSLIKSVGM